MIYDRIRGLNIGMNKETTEETPEDGCDDDDSQLDVSSIRCSMSHKYCVFIIRRVGLGVQLEKSTVLLPVACCYCTLAPRCSSI